MKEFFKILVEAVFVAVCFAPIVAGTAYGGVWVALALLGVK